MKTLYAPDSAAALSQDALAYLASSPLSLVFLAFVAAALFGLWAKS